MHFSNLHLFFFGVSHPETDQAQKKATVGARCCVEAVDLDFGSLAAHLGIA